MNITLSIDEHVADSARKAARSMGKSLNQAVRAYLEQLAGPTDRSRGGGIRADRPVDPGTVEGMAFRPRRSQPPCVAFLTPTFWSMPMRATNRSSRDAPLSLIGEHRSARSRVISTQVLQEYANVALRKLGLPTALVQERLGFYARFEVVMTSSALIADALDLFVLRSISFYDALIVRAAVAQRLRAPV